MARKLQMTGRGVKDVVVSTMNPVQRMAAYFDDDYTFVCKTCVSLADDFTACIVTHALRKTYVVICKLVEWRPRLS